MERGYWGVAALLVLAASAQTVCAGPILLIEDQGGFGPAAQILENEGFETSVVNNEFSADYAHLLDGRFLSQFDFIVYGERGDGFGSLLPQAVADSLENYIQSGGDLLVTGFDTLGSPPDPVLADLVRSSTTGDVNSLSPEWKTTAVDHPVLNGPYGDYRSMEFVASGYDDDNLTADTVTAGEGAVTLAVTPGFTERLIVADVGMQDGSVGYWNGGLSPAGEDFFDIVNAQPDFSFGGQPQAIFLNYAAWAVDTPTVPEPASALLLAIGAGGLAFGSRRRRRPLA